MSRNWQRLLLRRNAGPLPCQHSIKMCPRCMLDQLRHDLLSKYLEEKWGSRGGYLEQSRSCFQGSRVPEQDAPRLKCQVFFTDNRIIWSITREYRVQNRPPQTSS